MFEVLMIIAMENQWKGFFSKTSNQSIYFDDKNEIYICFSVFSIKLV